MSIILEKITDSELEIFETLFYPPALAECMFSDFGNLSNFSMDKLSNLRWYQYPMLSWEAFFDFEDQGLDKQEKFDMRKGASECYCLGGRLIGKSGIFQIVDIALRIFYSLWYGADEIAFSSFVFDKIQKVLDKLKFAVKNNPILSKLTPCNVKTQAPYQFTVNNTGLFLYGVNMNVFGRSPGANFYGIHPPILYIEEASKETIPVLNARKHSVSELGCIFRVSGMCDFKKSSPAGKAYSKKSNKSRILNLPQKVNPTYTKQADEDNIEEFGGKFALGYRIFSDGDVVENFDNVFDMERVRLIYDEKKAIKNYEIDKDSFPIFKKILGTIERPKNAERIFNGVDVGIGGGSTEITVFSELRPDPLNNTIYKYVYNITLFRLSDDEQQQIVDFLIEKLNAEMTAIDIGDGTGKAIYNELAKTYPNNLYPYYGNAKIPIAQELDKEGKPLTENNKPVYVYEFAAEYSVKRLQQLFYNGRFILPIDHKFDSQFDNVVAKYGANRVVYTCMSKNDHLFDSFRVFAIAQWLFEFKQLNPKPKKKMAKTSF